MNEIARFAPEMTVSATSSLINRCQNRRGSAGTKGHARGHVSKPEGCSNDDGCVENYSRNGWKTGFHEKTAQNKVVREFLKSPSGQEKLQMLNRGARRRSIHKRIPSTINARAGEWNYGRCTRTYTPDTACLVIEHQQGRESDSRASVQVLTCYPEKWERANPSRSDMSEESDSTCTSSYAISPRSSESEYFRVYECECSESD
ncbi:hypothetical protein GE061_014139 [Apolygus lucorum]|uniref:Uncharacterized protein n=1 Tax=Apolygus lucorum TaxID=248454 RepID=A0A6A4JVN6_APOLU|nr:hypothetical protein GE061_014139 [Apolygus lucorum]